MCCHRAPSQRRAYTKDPQMCAHLSPATSDAAKHKDNTNTRLAVNAMAEHLAGSKRLGRNIRAHIFRGSCTLAVRRMCSSEIHGHVPVSICVAKVAGCKQMCAGVFTLLMLPLEMYYCFDEATHVYSVRALYHCCWLSEGHIFHTIHTFQKLPESAIVKAEALGHRHRPPSSTGVFALYASTTFSLRRGVSY